MDGCAPIWYMDRDCQHNYLPVTNISQSVNGVENQHFLLTKPFVVNTGWSYCAAIDHNYDSSSNEVDMTIKRL